MVMTHAERAERRKQIAEFVEKHNGDVPKAAIKFGVSETTVQTSCLEHGVELQSKVAQRGTTVFMIIAELQRGTPISEAAKLLGVTRQRVGAVRAKCLEHGISLKRRR